MIDFNDKYGPWALITGASSGIGLEFARQLAGSGLNLILVARRENKLRTLASELQQKHAIRTNVVGADLSAENFLPNIQAATEGLEVGLLVNNAGYAITGNLVENDLKAEIEMLQVNGRAALILAHAYGKKMKQRGKGGIIFLSSVVGFTAVPLWTHYAATKSYSLLLAEGMASELKMYGVDVMALCPGSTRTAFHEGAGTKTFMAMNADAVVKYGLNKLGKKRVAIPGWINRFNVFSTKIQPRAWSAWIFGKVIQHIRKT